MPGKRRSMADFLAEQRAIEDPLAGDPRPGLAVVSPEEAAGRTSAVARLRPDQVAPTPLNSRSNFGTTEELGELGESMRVRQLQPVVVVSRGDYLRLWPEHQDQVPDSARYVLVNGERRWRAAAQAGLPTLEALVRPDLAGSRPAFLDAIFTENLDRRNLDPIEEARAVEEMVTECGSAVKAAEQFRRHESWVSQRRALLRLSPGLQDRVRSGDLPVRIARSIAGLPVGDQEAAWLEARDAEQARREGRRQARRQEEASGSPPPQPPQNGTARERDENGTPDGDFTAVKTTAPTRSAALDASTGTGEPTRPAAVSVRLACPPDVMDAALASLASLYGDDWQPSARKPSRHGDSELLQYGTLIVPVPEE